jgi:hypothetical protein
MIVWITLLAIVTITLVVALLRVRARSTDLPRPEAHGLPTLPVDSTGATIRSYVLPKRWLRSSPEKNDSETAAADHPRYSKATVERVGETGAAAGSWELLRGRTRLGRDSDNHVVLDDERVSAHHALITVRDGVYWLEDLGSTNGTFVGEEKRVMTAHPLVDGEEVRLGGVLLMFRGTPASL